MSTEPAVWLSFNMSVRC